MANEEQDVMITVKKEGHSFDTKLIQSEEIKDTNETSFSGLKMEIDVIEVVKAFTIDDI